MKKRIVKASELGRYAFCPRKFWLEQRFGWNKRELSRMLVGTKYHQDLLRGFSYGFLIRGALFILVVLLVAGIFRWLR